jgi:hypothetical protein
MTGLAPKNRLMTNPRLAGIFLAPPRVSLLLLAQFFGEASRAEALDPEHDDAGPLLPGLIFALRFSSTH